MNIKKLMGILALCTISHSTFALEVYSNQAATNNTNNSVTFTDLRADHEGRSYRVRDISNQKVKEKVCEDLGYYEYVSKGTKKLGKLSRFAALSEDGKVTISKSTFNRTSKQIENDTYLDTITCWDEILNK